MPDVLGLAAFGLRDSCVGGTPLQDTDFLPASVILPGTWRDEILTGRTAAENRLEAGFMWPQEARITDSTILRRVPVSLLWSKLVQDGDKLSSWKPSGGTAGCSTAKALHAHLAALLHQADWKNEDVVIAIPDRLDEMGQEELLRAFGECREHVQLLWRPVAAAMRWLHGLGPDFHLSSGDWMLVMYLGPDFLEVTAFDLQQDEGYPVPVRRSSKGKGLTLTGMDWAWSCCSGDSEGEVWQQVMRFPEVWESLTRQNSPQGHQQIWSRKDGSWELWTPEQNLLSWQGVPATEKRAVYRFGSRQPQAQDIQVTHVQPTENPWLSLQIARKNTDMKAADSWSDFFRKAIQETAKERSKQGLRGVVMCGPLIPQKRPGWFDSQSCAGRMQISRKPAPDTIWLPERTAADIVAEGAKLYGERLRDHLPTYLDTLPELKILTFKENDLGWTNMVESTVCKGGQEYENVVEGFCYQKRHSHLDAWLQRENENTYRKETVPLPFVPLKDIPINMHIRMKPASGLALVRLETLDHSIEDLLFDFSRMQEVTEPDFSRMLEASEPEKGELFCPKDEHIVLSEDIQSVDRNEFIWDCQRFVSAPKNITSLSYYETLRTKRLLPSCQPKFIDEKGNTQPEFEELMKTVRKQLVVCVGNLDNANLPNIIKKASFLWGKTPESFKKFLVDTLSRGLSDLQHTSQQGSLLANSVPPVSNTLPYAKNYAIGHRDVVEAAGRCFHKKEECRLLFQYIVRLNLNRAFAMEAAFNVLHYRPEAWQALDDKTAYGLLKIAIDMMEAQHTSKKVMFRNAASLIFVLLKYRLQDNHRDFLNDHDTTAKEFEVRQKLQKYIGEIEKSLNDQKDQKIKMAGRTRKNLENSLKYLKEIFDYIDFKGNPNAVPVWNNNPVKMGKKQRNN